MENHPIPQDITGFQFKLIGNMTIKQFAYLASGIVLGWISFVLPIFFLIKFPFMLLFIGIGTSLAFLPIEGRPLDTMISNFFKALISPTQYVYRHNFGQLWFPEIQKGNSSQSQTSVSLSGKKLQDYLDSLPKQSKNSLDQKELVFFQNLSLLHQGKTALNPVMLNMSMPQVKQQNPLGNDEMTLKQDEEQEVVLTKEEELLENELSKAKTEEGKNGENPSVHEKVINLTVQLSDLQKQKDMIEKELQLLNQKLSQAPKEAVAPKPEDAKPAPPAAQVIGQQQPTPTVQAPAAPPPAPKTTLPIPETPNLVTGIIRDPRGNPLQNILVEIKDKDSNPVRAFKTNGLGQFASATRIANGEYTIDFEDQKGQNKFKPISLVANGEIIMPVEVVSMDSREELRQSLFS